MSGSGLSTGECANSTHKLIRLEKYVKKGIMVSVSSQYALVLFLSNRERYWMKKYFNRVRIYAIHSFSRPTNFPNAYVLAL